MGLGYTAKDHRQRGLNRELSCEILKYCIAKGKKLFFQSKHATLDKRSFIGKSHSIAIF